jgi:F0F1-type ATP synthase membrane subunit b/b'
MTVELLGVIILSFTLAVVLFAYDRQLRELRKLKRDKVTLEEKARERAEELVRGARDKAVEIIGEAKVDAGRWQEVLDQELNKSLQEQMVSYQNNIQNVSQQITDEVKSEVVDLKKVLEMETVGAEKAAAERLKQEYARVDKEVVEYKAQKFKQVEDNVADILQEVGKKVFGRALDLNDQAELIIKALEEAKNQNVI